MNLSSSLRDQVFFIIRENPGIVRTEVRDQLKMQNNVVGPCIKELIDKGMIVEGGVRASRTTGKNGHTLWVAEDWKKELDCQNKLFDE